MAGVAAALPSGIPFAFSDGQATEISNESFAPKGIEMMFRSIMVPLDGSPFAEYALPYALRIARRTGAHIGLVHNHVPKMLRDPDGLLSSEVEAPKPGRRNAPNWRASSRSSPAPGWTRTTP